MRIARSWKPIAVALVLAHALHAQGVSRYDMGTATSPVAAGFTQVTPATTYSAALGHGWLPGASLEGLRRPAPHAHLQHVLADALLQDSVRSSASFTFRRSLPAGAYAGVVYLGDIGDPGAALLTPMTGMNVRVNGTLVAADVHARLAQGKATFDTAWGGYKRVCFLAQTDAAGNLDIEFSGSAGAAVSVMGIEMYPFLRAPLAFSHASSTLVAAPGYQTLMAGFLGAFNAHDYAAARSALDAIPSSPSNDLGKAWGYAWLCGWLTGDEHDVDTALLGEIQSLLAGQSPDAWNVASLLADARAFAKGELFCRTRGYSSAAMPENPDNLGDIVLNLSAGALLLEQMDDDILLPAALTYRPECPFFAKAQYLMARSMYGRNTHVFLANDWYSFVAFNTQFLGSLHALWSRLDPNVSQPFRLFPNAADATVLAWFMEEFIPPGTVGPLDSWSATPEPHPLPPIDWASTWFAQYTEFPTPYDPPAWASYQRRYARTLRNVGSWWMQERLLGSELGGGGGDDTEGAGALGLPTVIKSEGPYHPFERGIKKVLEGVLFGPEVDQDQGFVDPPGGVMDPEHAGEYTTYPLFFLLPTYYGSPRYLEFAMRTIRNMIEPPDPILGDTAWTGIPGWTQWRHFKAFRVGPNGYELPTMGGPNVDMDITEIMKVIDPGFYLIDNCGLGEVKQIWYEYGRAWTAAAMSTAPGYALPKPEGIFPIGVDYGTGAFGEANQWWVNNQQNGGGVGLHNLDLYFLLLTAYRNSNAPQAERIKLLEPLQKAVKFLSPAAPDPLAPPGTDAWTAHHTKGAISQIAFMARKELVVDLAGDPAQIDYVIDQYAPPYVKYLHAPAPAVGPKDKTEIEKLYRDDSIWLRHFWPLATTTVAYTDRIGFAAGAGFHGLYAGMGGSQPLAAPTFNVTWAHPSPPSDPGPYQHDLDFAILLNELHGDATPASPLALKALLYHFGPSAAPIDLRVWRGLPAGTYHLELGADVDRDDHIDGTPTVLPSQALNGRGDTLSIPAVPPGVQYVVDLILENAGGTTPATLDLGIAPEDITASGATVKVAVHNLGTTDFPSGTGALVRLYDDVTNASLGAALIPAVLAPVGLNPSLATTTISYAVSSGQRLRAKLSLPAAMAQITTLNDRAVQQF